MAATRGRACRGGSGWDEVAAGERTVRGRSLPAEQRWGGRWGAMLGSCSHAPFPSFYRSLLLGRRLTMVGDPEAAGLGGAQGGMRAAACPLSACGAEGGQGPRQPGHCGKGGGRPRPAPQSKLLRP